MMKVSGCFLSFAESATKNLETKSDYSQQACSRVTVVSQHLGTSHAGYIW